MGKCLICRNPAKGKSDYCQTCFDEKLEGIKKKYEEKEGPSVPAKETGGAPASEPEEDTQAFSFLSQDKGEGQP